MGRKHLPNSKLCHLELPTQYIESFALIVVGLEVHFAVYDVR